MVVHENRAAQVQKLIFIKMVKKAGFYIQKQQNKGSKLILPWSYFLGVKFINFKNFLNLQKVIH